VIRCDSTREDFIALSRRTEEMWNYRCACSKVCRRPKPGGLFWRPFFLQMVPFQAFLLPSLFWHLKMMADNVITLVDTSYMPLELKVRRVGNSLGVVLPKEALTRLNVADGDQLYITEAPDGFRITAADPEFARQMEVAKKGMKRYRNALRALAK
jgi:putative addiction module antidote